MKNLLILTRRVCVILVFLAFASLQSPAQYFGPIVQGTVTDEQDQPLCGVAVYEAQNVGNSTTTDLNGRYSINITRGNNSVLVFEYTGYETKRIVYKGCQTINVKMVEQTN